MAQFNVSNARQLNDAIDDAKGGDRITLASGNYGKVDLSGEKFSSAVTITANGNAVINKLTLSSASNITFDGITFDYDPGRSGTSKPFWVNNSSNITFRDADFQGHVSGGYGSGTGISTSRGSNIRIENSDFSDFKIGAQFWATQGLSVVNNDFNKISYDGIVMGHVRNVLIDNNDIEMRAQPRVDHKDVIQVYNQGPDAPASNVTIRNNTLSANDPQTHGIYFGNNDAKASGGSREFFQNIVIENNTLKTGHILGIALGQTDGGVIRNNAVLQHPEMNSSRESNIPVIRIDKNAVDIKVSGNTGHETPKSAGSNWQPSDGAERGWSISNNKVVSLGASGSAPKVSRSDDRDDDRDDGRGGDRDDDRDEDRGGGGDTFRFVSDGGRTDTLSDFQNGDRIQLSRFDNGTFRDVSGGNIVHNSKDGSYVAIDSVTDLQELVGASRDISAARSGGDTLLFRIAQDDGAHTLAFRDLADRYFDSYDSDLF